MASSTSVIARFLAWLDAPRRRSPPANLSGGTGPTTKRQGAGGASDFSWLLPPCGPAGADAWDHYWDNQLAHGLGPPLFDMFCDDRMLISAMFAQQMRTVLGAGSGISQEPRALAAAGFEVVGLDISPRALDIPQRFPLRDDVLECFLDPASHLPGGHVEYVVGDILILPPPPAPSTVIERRTAQNYAEPQSSLVLSALIARLSPEGIFFTHCHDGRWRPPATPRNVTFEWWLAHGDVVWDGESRPKPPGQVAMKFTSTG